MEHTELIEQFHDFIADSWTILFSHPDDYVSTVSEFERRTATKLMVLERGARAQAYGQRSS